MFDLEMTRGDDRILKLTATWPEALPPSIAQGDPYDLSGKALWFTAKLRKTDADANAVFQKTHLSGISVNPQKSNEARIEIKGSDTASLTKDAVLECDAQVKDGEKVFTVASGKLRVKTDVTRTG